MRLSRLAPAIAVALCATSLSAQTFWPDEGPRTWAPRPTEGAITANDLRTRLYQFADDSMMGREAGTLGNIKGTEYIAAEFKRLGLIPAGENGGYFQNLDFGVQVFAENKVQLMVGRKALTPSVDWTPMTPNAGMMVSGTAKLQNVATIFGGRYGDPSTTLNAAQYRGKVVVFLAPPAAATRGAVDVEAFTKAQSAGAVAVLIVTDAPSTAGFRARTGVLPTVRSTTAGAEITAAVAQQLFGAPIGSVAVGTTGATVTGAWNYELTPSKYPVRNVLAILPGSDAKLRGQYVIIGAHNDHVGMVPRERASDHDSLRAFNTLIRPQGANDRVPIDSVQPAQWAAVNTLLAAARRVRPAEIDTVMNGADDDGSGSMVMLEIAERMSTGARPARSVLFNSHAGEEKGLIGSAWWTDHPTIPLDSVVVAHNMDMLGKGRVSDVRFGGPNTVQMLGSRRVSLEFGDMIDSLNAVRDEPMVIDYSWDRTNRLNRFCRSDQVSYIRKGIPTTYFSTGYSRDYHQATDEPRYINYDLSARVARFVHDIALTAANRPERLAVLPKEEQDPAARCGG